MYLSLKENVQTKTSDVRLLDLCDMLISPDVREKLKTISFEITEEQQVILLLDVIERIQREVPGEEIISVGASSCLVKKADMQNAFWKFLKTAVSCLDHVCRSRNRHHQL